MSGTKEPKILEKAGEKCNKLGRFYFKNTGMLKHSNEETTPFDSLDWHETQY